MKPPDEVKREFVKDWLAKADADLAAARHLLKGGEAFASTVAFHAQQAAEKHLKAMLVWRQVEFSKTHDVAQILDLVRVFDTALADELSAAVDLTVYAVAVRYPSEMPEPSLDEAKEALVVAEKVRGAILKRLPTGLGSPG